MRSATLSSFFAMACLGSFATCGSSTDDGNLLITFSNLPDRATKLSFTATLDEKMAMGGPQTAAAAKSFGIGLPSGSTGHFVLNIQATDADGCLQAKGTLDTTLSGRYTELPLTLNVQSPRQCGNLGCAAGMICSYTPKPITTNLWGIWGSSPNDMWTVGDGGIALHYDGTSWQNSATPTTLSLNGVWGSSAKDVWAVGASGKIIHYDGQSWMSSPNAAVYDLSAVYGVSPTDVWTVGLSSSTTTPGEFWHWDGTSWTKKTTGTTGSLLSVWASSPNDITASGSGGLLIHYNGTAWSTITTSTTNELRSVWGVSSNLVFAGGAQATLLRNDGTGWKKIVPSGYGSTLYGIGGDNTTVYGVGNSNATGNSIKGTAPFDSFNVQNSGSSDLTGVFVGSNGIAWVSGKLGYLGYFDTRP